MAHNSWGDDVDASCGELRLRRQGHVPLHADRRRGGLSRRPPSRGDVLLERLTVPGALAFGYGQRGAPGRAQIRSRRSFRRMRARMVIGMGGRVGRSQTPPPVVGGRSPAADLGAGLGGRGVVGSVINYVRIYAPTRSVTSWWDPRLADHAGVDVVIDLVAPPRRHPQRAWHCAGEHASVAWAERRNTSTQWPVACASTRMHSAETCAERPGFRHRLGISGGGPAPPTLRPQRPRCAQRPGLPGDVLIAQSYMVSRVGARIPISTDELVSAIDRVRNRRSVDLGARRALHRGAGVDGRWCPRCSCRRDRGESLRHCAQVVEAISKSSARPTDPRTDPADCSADSALADRRFGPGCQAELDRTPLTRVGCWVGAWPGTQRSDIARGCGLFVGKGLDQRGGRAVAQLNIQTFQDTAHTVRCCRWLESRGVSPASMCSGRRASVGHCCARLRREAGRPAPWGGCRLSRC